MSDTFKKIWAFSANRHDLLIKAWICSMIRSFFGAAQLGALMIAIYVLTGKAEVKTAVLWIAGLCLLCVLGNFATSYMEQIHSMKTGFYMVADKRVSLAVHMGRMPLGFSVFWPRVTGMARTFSQKSP